MAFNWPAMAIYDNIPDDIWGVALKLPAAILVYPIKYICLCFEAAWKVEFDDLQRLLRFERNGGAGLHGVVSSQSRNSNSIIPHLA